MASLVAAMLGAPAAQAADDNWSNPATSYQQWTTGTNWDLGTAPTAAQTAAIANGGWAKIDSSVSFSTLTIGSTSQLQLLDGAGLSSGAITNNSLLTVTNNSALTLSNTIGGSGNLSVNGSAPLTLTAVNIYSGATTIAAGSTLAVSGGGTIINSSVDVTGIFDISQFSSNDPAISDVDLKNLTGSGTVALGAKVLTVRAASGTFSGVIADGGIGGGTGGVFGIRGGTLTLTGVSTFHGQISDASGAALALAGNGSLPNASVNPGGTGANFDISQTNSGATIAGLLNGSGSIVALGSKTLTIAVATASNPPFNFGGVIQDGGIAGGSGGGVTIASGLQMLSGTNAYTGLTTISSGATLALSKNDIITASSGVVDNGTLDVSTGSGTIKTLSGAGIVALGSETLTLTAQSGTFSGTMQDGGVFGGKRGGVTLTGGTLILTGVNTYTGSTTISAGTVQMGAGGSLASTSTLAVNGGTFDLNGQTETIGVLSGTGGFITLGAGSLTTIGGNTGFFNNILANTTLASIISGSGSFTKTGIGTLTLSGANNHTGGTTISGGMLQISGSGTLGANSGALTISGGVLDLGATVQTQNGGVTLSGGTVQNGTLSSSGTFALQSGTASAVLAGSGAVSKTTSGTVILSGANSYTGGTTISAGTLQIGNGGTSGAITGNVTDNGTLTFNRSDAVSFAAVISGSGAVAQAGSGTLILTGANTYTGGTTVSAGTLQTGTGGSLASTGALAVNGGTFDLNGQTQTVGALSGTGGSIALGAGSLTANSATSTILASAISGSGSFTKDGSGTLTLSGANTYTGGTTISAGTLQIGSGGTSGAITGNVTDNGTLVFNRSDSVSFAAVISGGGAVMQAGSGTLTLSGTNSFTGGTTINAGTLNVTGTVAAVAVASGGTLTGTGHVGTTSVASGGVLSPGAGGTTGTLTVAGNLTLAGGAGTVDYFTPTDTGLIAVSGTAGVNGTLTANAASGTYTAGQRYTLVTATGGVSGTFASLTTPNLPAYLTGRLSYDANDVFLNLDANELAPSLGAAASANQTSVTTALDTAVKSGKAPNRGLTSLFTLSGANLGTALNQATGDIGAKASQAAGQSFSPFFNVLMGRGETNNSTRVATNGVPHGVMPAQLAEGAMDVWGTIYGGHTAIAADPATGAASLSSGAFGIAGGIEAMFGDELLAGASIGFGHQSFRSGGSSGKSDDVMLGLYGRKNFGQAYVSGALGYGWHDITTLRSVTLSGTDVLGGKFTADDFAGRVEGGYRLALDEQLGLTPFAALAGERFHTPAYTEINTSGSANFALAYTASNSTASHSELGGKLDRDFAVDAQTLSLEGMLAWAHQLSSRPSAQAAFADLPGSGFVLLGVRPATDTALLGLGLQMHDTSGLVYGARVQGQTGGGTDVITGALNLAYHW
jgi:autotransporter-associated beta strand protein